MSLTPSNLDMRQNVWKSAICMNMPLRATKIMQDRVHWEGHTNLVINMLRSCTRVANLGQMVKIGSEEQQHAQYDAARDQTGNLCLATDLVLQSGARQGSRTWIGQEERGKHVSRANGDEFLVGPHNVCILLGNDLGQRQRHGEAHYGQDERVHEK